MSENNNVKILSIVAFVCLIVLLSLPFFEVYILKRISFDQQIDPELMTGLLTASSILFGFSTFFVSPVVEKKKYQKILFLILLFPLATMIFAGASIYEVSIGRLNGVEAMLRLYTNFSVNVACTAFIVGFKWATIKKNKGDAKNE